MCSLINTEEGAMTDRDPGATTNESWVATIWKKRVRVGASIAGLFLVANSCTASCDSNGAQVHTNSMEGNPAASAVLVDTDSGLESSDRLVDSRAEPVDLGATSVSSRLLQLAGN